MMMPFGSAFSTNNLGLTMEQLPVVYLIVGIFSIATGPIIGKLSDKVGKYKIFVWGTVIACITVAVYTPLGITPIWVVILLSVIMFAGITARMITSGALMSAVPAPQDRGAFMAITASVQQIAGGIASAIAGMIVYQAPNGMLHRYDVLGYVVIGTMIMTIIMMYWIDRHIKEMMQRNPTAQKPPVTETLAAEA
jgi:predicted MFS family arabinose efflux permease